MTTELPKLRQDLVVSRQESPEGVVYVLKDPTIRRFVRFKEPEYFIAQQFDGATSLEEIRRRSEEHFGAVLPQATLEQFTRKLNTLNLLVPPTEADTKDLTPKALPRRIQGNPLCLRFKAFDPDRFLERITPRLSLLFTRGFAWFSGAVIALAVWVTAAGWADLHRSLPQLYRPETLVLAWLTFVSIVVGHEFAHGVTCKHFGGKVHEIGFLLIYLQPAMYCNVSDAWLFPSKRHRLLVTLAGAWFEVFCWAVATLLWRISDPATVVNYLALVVATTLGIKSLFNLNPLIKLDGYYLLSDYLEIPNLRKNAFQYISQRVRYLWGSRSELVEATRLRERKIYWRYGILAAVYSGWLMGFLLLALGSFLIRRYQGWGFLGFTTILLIVFRSPLQSGLRFLASHFAPARGIIPIVKRVVRLFLVLAVLGLCLFFIKTDLKVSGEFRILPIHNADVRAEVEGIIEEIFYDEGDVVKPGDVIARLSDRDYRAELDKLKAQIDEKQAQLRMLKSGPRSEEIELARITVLKGEEKLKYAKAYLEMEKTLFDEKLTSKKDFEVAEELVSVRNKELEESKGTLKLLLAGSREEVIDATQAELNRLTAQQRYLENQLERLRIVSPIAGIVTTHRLKEKLGSNLKKGDLVAEVHDLQTVTAEIAVAEKEISEVRVGQSIVLKARAHLGESLKGTVKTITPVATKSEAYVTQRDFLVITELPNPNQMLKPEMTGNAKIYCGERRLFEIVFRRFVRFVRVEFWSWW